MPEMNPVLLGKSIHEVRDYFAPVRAEIFDRRVSRSVFAVLQKALGMEDVPVDSIRTSEDLKEMAGFPFILFPLDVTVPAALLSLKRKHCDNVLRFAVARLLPYMDGRDGVFVFRVGRQLMAAHTIEAAKVTGQLVSLNDAKFTVLFLDPLAFMLKAVARNIANAGSDAVGLGGIRGNAAQAGFRFARISGSILPVLPTLGKRDIRLYVTICLCADYGSRTLTLGQAKLAEYASVRQPYVPRGVRKLVESGLIRVSGGCHRHKYEAPLSSAVPRFLDVPKWVLDASSGWGVHEWRVYLTLLRLAIPSEERRVRAGQRRLGELAAVAPKHLPGAVRHLEESGVVIVERPGRGERNDYWLPARPDKYDRLLRIAVPRPTAARAGRPTPANPATAEPAMSVHRQPDEIDLFGELFAKGAKT